MMKKGFTLIEILVAVVLMFLLITALWNVFSASRRNADAVMSAHIANNAVELALIKITDDVREANAIDKDLPPTIDENEIDSIKTDADNNILKFYKVEYDFLTDPNNTENNKLNYVKDSILYFLDKSSSGDGYTLYKQSIPIDKDNKEVISNTVVIPVLSNIKSCAFYKLKDPHSSRSGNVYIKLVMKSDSSNYFNETTISVKERAACTE